MQAANFWGHIASQKEDMLRVKENKEQNPKKLGAIRHAVRQTCEVMNASSDAAEFKNITHAPKGGAARAAVIAQSPEVKTTQKTQPRYHGKQTNTKYHSHDTPTI